MGLFGKLTFPVYAQPMQPADLQAENESLRKRVAELESARDDALEEAAIICGQQAKALDHGSNEYTRSRECEIAEIKIRALKGK